MGYRAKFYSFRDKLKGFRLDSNWQRFFIGVINLLSNENIFKMRSILYLIAVILIIGWLLGVFVYSATGLIHILIVLAVISLLIGIMRRA